MFGRGLVKAHELESKFAKRPRIIVSARAAEKLGSHLHLHSDDDGFLCLDYVRAAYDLEIRAVTPQTPAARALAARNWIDEIRRLCEDQISDLTRTQKPGLQNWHWFSTRFERFVASL
jgi:hypothetical protein